MPDSCPELLPECASEFATHRGAIAAVKDTLDRLMDNHIPSIEKKLDELNGKVNSRPTWLVTCIFSALLSLIIGLLVKMGIK